MPSQEAVAMMDAFRAQRPDPSAPEPSYPQRRELTGQMFASIDPLAADVVTEDVAIAGVSGRWVSLPDGDPSRTVLYLHGGGHVVGGVDSHQGVAARIARAARARVLVLDYRLAPEDPFPAGLEDAIGAYQELVESGLEPARIALAGDSSGGGLVLSALVALRDRGAPLPGAAVLLSPWGDLTLSGATIEYKAPEDPMIDRANLELWAGLYAGDTSLAEPLVSPVNADLSGLPPLLIQVGTAEVLLSDSDRLAKKVADAGGIVSYEPAEGLFHTYQLFPHLPEARDAVERVGAFLDSHLR